MTTNAELVSFWGQRGVAVFGTNPDVDMGTGLTEDVWDVGGMYPFPAAALPTTIVSDSLDDTGVGTGAQTVIVQYLLPPEQGFGLVVETLTLNGTTPVPFTQDAYRFLLAVADDVGSADSNVVTLDILHSGATTIGRVLPDMGRSSMAIHTVPGGIKRAQLKSLQTFESNTNTGVARIVIRFRRSGKAWQEAVPILALQEPTQIILSVPILFVPGTDILMRVTEATVNNMAITAILGLDFLT